MEKEFIPYDLALRMKALGFDEPCLGYYAGDILCTGQPQEIHLDKDGNYKKTKTDSYPIIAAPTFSQAFRWFRDNYGYLVGPFQNEDNLFFFEIGKLNSLTTEYYSPDCNTYEEAELACLNKLIEIVKQK